MGVGVLAHHDGVIDDDAERHDEREQAHHVDRAAEEEHEREGGEKGGRNADHHPQGDARGEEKVEHGDHQQQARQAIADEQLDALADELPLRIEHLQADARRQRRSGVLEPVVEHAGGLERVSAFAALELQFDHAVTTLEEGELVGSRFAGDGGDLAEADHAMLVAHHRQRCEGLGAAALLEAANLARAIGFAGHAGWNVAGERADAFAHLDQGEPQGLERRGGNLDRDPLLG